jgi:ribosomal protein S17E
MKWKLKEQYIDLIKEFFEKNKQVWQNFIQGDQNKEIIPKLIKLEIEK